MADRKASGRQIAATPGNVTKLGVVEWSVRSQSDPERAYRVHYTASYGFVCECPDYGHGNKCKHIWAVIHDRSNKGDTSELIGPFEADRINREIREYLLNLVPHESGWLLHYRSRTPIIESDIEEQVIEPLIVVTDHARKTRTCIFIWVDHTKFDYTGWMTVPRNTLGVTGVAKILADMGFVQTDFRDNKELFVFDPVRVPDPFDRIPGGKLIRQFLEDDEEAFHDLAGGGENWYARQELSSFRLRKYQLYKRLKAV